ncbi:unnamed protein product [Amoebophrya sp. A25]|nr:unnamed protein product [Amoebophrya sp. A25]|eukprot:GSA25T00027176001.1
MDYWKRWHFLFHTEDMGLRLSIFLERWSGSGPYIIISASQMIALSHQRDEAAPDLHATPLREAEQLKKQSF